MNKVRFELPLLKATGALRITARTQEEGTMLVFLDIARTLEGMVRSIPQKGGKKYDWPGKITFHLDLEELAAFKDFLVRDTSDKTPFCVYHQTAGKRPKKLSIIKGEKEGWIARAEFEGKETVLTLNRPDISLLILGLTNLMESMLWKTIL